MGLAMNILKKTFPLIIAASFSGLVIILHLFFSAAGITSGTIQGFALDAQENLYIGVGKKIFVYAAGKEVDVLYPPVSMIFRFFIQDEKLVIGCQDRRVTRIYDLSGNYISRSDLTYEEVLAIAESQKTIEQNGNVYSYVDYSGFKPAEIRCNGNVIFKMSYLDFLFTGLPFVTILVAFGGLLAFAIIIFVTDEEVKSFLRTLW